MVEITQFGVPKPDGAMVFQSYRHAMAYGNGVMYKVAPVCNFYAIQFSGDIGYGVQFLYRSPGVSVAVGDGVIAMDGDTLETIRVKLELLYG